MSGLHTKNYDVIFNDNTSELDGCLLSKKSLTHRFFSSFFQKLSIVSCDSSDCPDVDKVGGEDRIVYTDVGIHRVRHLS